MIKVFVTIREGRSLDPTVERQRIEDAFGTTVLRRLPIERLAWDNEVVSSKVSSLQSALEEGQSLPPILVAPEMTNQFLGGQFRVVDGNHRVAAALRCGQHDIWARVPSSYK